MPLAVVEEGKVRLPGQLLAAIGHAAQAALRLIIGSRWRRTARKIRLRPAVGQRQAGLRDGQQVAAEVAAVDGGDVHRQQRLAARGVVPVEEVAPMALQAIDAVQGVLQPAEQLRRVDPAEFARASHAQQVQADVGRRGALRQHVMRRRLQVVWRQVTVGRRHAALEVAPSVTRQHVQVRAILLTHGG